MNLRILQTKKKNESSLQPDYVMLCLMCFLYATGHFTPETIFSNIKIQLCTMKAHTSTTFLSLFCVNIVTRTTKQIWWMISISFFFFKTFTIDENDLIKLEYSNRQGKKRANR